MATEAELLDALQKAHAAGEEDHARILANEIVKMRGASTPAASAQGFQLSAATPAGPDTSLTQNLGVVNKALAPYAAAATTGALMGAPLGGVGAVPGAGIGVMALGAGDLGTTLYNAATPLWNGKRVQTPSETIRQGMVGAGMARDPQTEEQNMLYAIANGAGSGLTGAAGFNALRGFTTGTTGKVFGQLAENPGNQAVAGAAGSALPTALNQYGGIDNPYVLAGSSLIGNIAGGAAGSKVLPAIAGGVDRGVALATGKPYEPPAGPLTMDQLKARAQTSFTEADKSGAVYDPQKFKGFVSDLENKLTGSDYYSDNPLHKPIEALLKRAGEATTEAQTISWMHDFRQAIGRARANQDKDVRRLAGMMGDELDSFVTNPTNAVNATPNVYSYQPTAPAVPPAAPAPVPTRPAPSVQPSAPTSNSMNEWNRVTQSMAGPAAPRAYEPAPVEPVVAPTAPPVSVPTRAPTPNSMNEWSRVTQRMGTPAPEGLNLPAAAESQANVKQGSEALMSGINDWRKLSRAQEIETAINRAQINASAGDKDFADTVRQQFAVIARNENRMKKFSSDERQAIMDLVEGKSSGAITKALSVLAPKFSGPNIASTTAKIAGEVALGHQLGGNGLTGVMMAPIVAGTVGYGANSLRNTRAENAANALAQNVRNGFIPRDIPQNYLPSLPYASNALAQGQ